jgi:FkbM family methyltransferase
MGKLANFVVLPFAVSETDGASEFHLNSRHESSSLLPFNPKGLSQWIGGEELQTERIITVPTMRLDTFMNQAGIPRVDFLKIDTQGADLNVLKSAGERLRDFREVVLEVSLTPTPLYEGSHSKEECICFMTEAGFTLTKQENQSHGQEANLTFILPSEYRGTTLGPGRRETTQAGQELIGQAAGKRRQP